MIIHAYDPGETTGHAIYNASNHKFVTAGDFPDMQEVGMWGQPDLVIIEAFKLYSWKANSKKWSSFPEVEVIGALKFWCLRNNVKFVEQGADCKQLFSDDKLKALNLWKSYSRHARDAMRHALYYTTCAGDTFWLEKL